MKTYGPITFTINTPFKIGMDAAAVAVQIHNNSGLSLRVYFGAAAPTNYQDAAHWHATISPGAHPVLPVNASSGYFDGTLSFFPFSEQGAPTQTPGVIAASNILTFEAYFTGEQLPQSVYSPVFQQGAAQQRVVSVPPAGRMLANGAPFSLTGPAPALVITQATASPADLGYFPIDSGMLIYQANQQGIATFVNIYLMALEATMRATTNDTQTVLEFTLEVSQIRAHVVINGPLFLYTGALVASVHAAAPTAENAGRIGFYPAFAQVTTMLIPSGTLQPGDLFTLRYRNQASLSNFRLFLNPVWGVDATNQSPMAYYGGVNPNPLGPGSETTAMDPHTY